jgi:hypothetical protein
MLIKGIALFVGLCFLFPYPCEHPQDTAELKQVIELIKEKTTQFTSVWCRYETFSEDRYLSSRYKMIKEGKNQTPELSAKEIIEIAFTCDKRNFYYIIADAKTLKNTILPFILSPAESKVTENITTSPTSLMDIIKRGIEEQSQKHYLQHSLSNNEVDKSVFFREASYMKDGKISSLYISGDKKEVYESLDDFFPNPTISPLNMVGRVGFGTEDNLISTWGISLSEFLDLPGPFHLHHEGEYTILWHRANYFEESLGKEVPLSLDIRIDQKGDIRQIDYVEYYGRIWKTEDFQKCGYDGIINCMTPKWIEKTYFFDDYTMTSKGVRFPLKGREEIYYTDTTTSDGFQLDKDVIQGVISREEYLVKRCFSPVGVDTLYEFSIIPTSLKVNEPIPEDVFTAPPITERKAIGSQAEKNQLWNIPFRAMIFVGFGVMIVLVLMYLTHRYLGWSFF